MSGPASGTVIWTAIGTDKARAVVAALSESDRTRLMRDASLALYVQGGEVNVDSMSADGLTYLRAQLDGYALLAETPEAPAYPMDGGSLAVLLHRVITTNEDLLEPPTAQPLWEREDVPADERAQLKADAQKQSADARAALDLARRVLNRLVSDPDHVAPVTVTLSASDPVHRELASHIAGEVSTRHGLALEDAADDKGRQIVTVAHRMEAMAFGVTPAAIDAVYVAGNRAYAVAGLLGDPPRADAVSEAYWAVVRQGTDESRAKLDAERGAFLAWAALCPDATARERLTEAFSRADASLGGS